MSGLIFFNSDLTFVASEFKIFFLQCNCNRGLSGIRLPGNELSEAYGAFEQCFT